MYDNRSVNLTGLRDAKVLRLLKHISLCIAHIDDYFHRELAKQGRLPGEWTAPLDRQKTKRKRKPANTGTVLSASWPPGGKSSLCCTLWQP